MDFDFLKPRSFAVTGYDVDDQLVLRLGLQLVRVLRRDGEFYPIDFANPCPDSQVTSLNFHFPWIVTAQLRWAVFCATTRRPMRAPGLGALLRDRERDLSYRERLAAYARVADERLETERFEEFCAEHLGHLDEVAVEFFGTDAAKTAVRSKVEAMFPGHEVERFTEHFWQRVQLWREQEGQKGDPDGF